jgi:hypothetical protein
MRADDIDASLAGFVGTVDPGACDALYGERSFDAGRYGDISPLASGRTTANVVADRIESSRSLRNISDHSRIGRPRAAAHGQSANQAVRCGSSCGRTAFCAMAIRIVRMAGNILQGLWRRSREFAELACKCARPDPRADRDADLFVLSVEEQGSPRAFVIQGRGFLESRTHAP